MVAGEYRLGKLVRSEGRCAWFETRLLNEKPALISLTESLNDEAALLDRLRAAAKIRHANVAAILQAGTTTVQDTPLVYAVMEYTEENLDDVLRARALSPEETKQVAESLIKALEALHKERLACGRLEAASVLAAGDTIKLRSDHLQIVPRDADIGEFAAKDVRGLGVVLYQCLMQRRPKADGNDASIQLLPAPFVQIVRKALSGQATVAEIAGMLHPAVSAAPPAPQNKPTPAQAAPKAVIPEKKQTTQEQTVKEQTIKKRAILEEEKSASEGVPGRMLWIIGAIVVFLVIAAFVAGALRHAKQASGASERSSAAAPPAATPAAARPAQPKPTASGVASGVASGAPAGVAPAGAWRVVVFTYNHRDQAEHKARTIEEKHPELQAGVFSPKGNGAPYLVTLGGPMDRASAFQLRGKAIRSGLPRDTYAQNYSR